MTSKKTLVITTDENETLAVDVRDKTPIEAAGIISAILEVIPGRTDIAEKPSYDVKNLSRDFPQIFKSGGKVRKSRSFKKYSLREAMNKLTGLQSSIDYTIQENEGCELSFITDVSLITIKGAAAHAIRKNPDFLYDFIDAGWEFYFTGC